MDKTLKFIEKANIIHKDVYDYGKSIYLKTHSKIIITCREHGDFLQTPSRHLQGDGCPDCGRMKTIESNKSNSENFIIKAKSIHNEKFDYSKTVYINIRTDIEIICNIDGHGSFFQKPDKHLKSKNCCPKCLSNNKSSNINLFIERSNKIHNNLYDYSKSVYKNRKEKVIITCSDHGDFLQTPNDHLRGHGCPECGRKLLRNTTEKFIENSLAKNNNKFDYSKTEYTTFMKHVNITCKKHNITFKQLPVNHLQGKNGCPECNKNLHTSIGEQELFSFVSSLADCQQNNRSIISPYELDIFIPSHSLAIEFNGLYWHSEINKPRSYHYDKYLKCHQQGIRLIQIWEHEWLNNRELCESFLSSLLAPQTKLYARKLTLKEVSITEQREFLDKFHFQGYSSSSACLGLYHNDVLIQLMSLRKLNQSGDYEIGRLCTRSGYVVVGGSERLFSSLKSSVNYSSIISYNNLDKFSGEVYERLGMKIVSDRSEGYFYTNGKEIFTRQQFQKHKLVAQGYDTSLTELEITSSLGLLRVFPTGSSKYKL